MSAESQAKLLEAERVYHQKAEAARGEAKAREEQLAAELEALRQQKDARIRQGERDREEQRNAYELRINALDAQIKSKHLPFK